MSERDYGRTRDVVTHGWQFMGLVKNPCAKKDLTPGAPDNRPLTAEFEYVVTRNGVKQDNVNTWMIPHQRYLTPADIADGFQARVHSIPSETIETGRKALAIAEAPKVLIIASAPKLVAA